MTPTEHIPTSNSTITGRHKTLSAANLYKMQADLKRLLNNIRKQLPVTRYEEMYSRIINLNNKETLNLHAELESGDTNSVFNFLSRGAVLFPAK